MTEPFERGVVVLSIDTEQFWGYRDLLSPAQYEARYPDIADAHAKLLARLVASGVRATWFVVGGLALPDTSRGDAFARLLYCRPFLDRLRRALPRQEIGLHGGLTHLIWTDARSTREMIRGELQRGISALAPLAGQPRSFSFPRNGEDHYALLVQNGFRCFRGTPPAQAWRLGRSLPGRLLRAWDELHRSTPPLVWPAQTIPGLWNIPASTFLYPMGPARARLIGLHTRAERFRRGIQAAAQYRAVFHFGFHPENLAESPLGFAVLDDILETLVRARGRGDIEIMTMQDVADRMERKPYAWQEQHQYPELSKADRRP